MATSSPSRQTSRRRTRRPQKIELIEMCLYEDFDGLIINNGDLVVDPEEKMRGGGEVDPVATYIYPNIGRIISLTCLLNKREHILGFLNIPAGRFRSLKVLRLSLVDESHSPSSVTYAAHSQNFTVFNDLPDLRYLTIHCQGGPPPAMIIPPLHRLTALGIVGVKLCPGALISILHCLPSLTQGDFVIAFCNPAISTAPFPPLRMPRLKQLQLALHNPRRDTRFFSALIFEELESLVILGSDFQDKRGWDLDIFVPFLRHSSRTLKTLILRDLLSPGSSNLEEQYLYMQERIGWYTMDSLVGNHVYLRTLEIPMGVYVRQETLEDMACGLTLPSLTSLNVSHDRGSAILHMVIDRNENARDFPELSGIMGVKPISDIVLSVPNDFNCFEVGRIQRMQEKLERSSACQQTQLSICYHRNHYIT